MSPPLNSLSASISAWIVSMSVYLFDPARVKVVGKSVGCLYNNQYKLPTPLHSHKHTYTPRWFVGSSRMTMCGLRYASSAKAARDFWPPERKRMGFMASSPLSPNFPMKDRSSWLSALGSGGVWCGVCGRKR